MNKGIFQTKLRTGDEVIVISGKDVGKKGTLREILKSKNKGIVTGINMVKKHKKATKENKGGIITKEAFMHLSNLKKIDENKKTKKWNQD